MKESGCGQDGEYPLKPKLNGVANGHEDQKWDTSIDESDVLEPGDKSVTNQESDPILGDFLHFLKDEFDPIAVKIQASLSEGNIRFEYLWRFFPVDSVVLFRHYESGRKCAGKVFNY